MRLTTLPQPSDPYFTPDLPWEFLSEEELNEILPMDFQGPSLPPLQGPITPSQQGPYLSNRLFNSEDPF